MIQYRYSDECLKPQHELIQETLPEKYVENQVLQVLSNGPA